MLSDTMIHAAIQDGELEVEPYNMDDLQPASLDVHLGDTFLKYDGPPVIDFADPPVGALSHKRFMVNDFWLHPGGFVLGSTLERVRIGNQYSAHFDGRSTLGRLGIMVHVTAGFIDPGFNGNITLEIKNLSETSYRFKAGMGIGQLLFHTMEGRVMRPYGSPGLGSKYDGIQRGARAPILRKEKL
jgi:dCTP deaminase